MTCTACARRVEKNLNKVEGVSAFVDFASEKAHITAAPQVTQDALRKAVEDAGYKVGSNRSELTSLLWRLWIGALIALPVAIISMFHQLMPPNWHTIAAIATLPIATWVTWPFHSAAFKNLKLKTSTMDTLVSLGVIVAYGYSVIQLFIGGMDVYFEVAAVVPTVVLFGRWLEVRTRRSATDSVRALLSAIPETAEVRRDGAQLTLPTAQVKLGDLVVVATGQRIPVDGEVVEGASQIDNALITGESVPEEVSAGHQLHAGAVNLGATLVIKTTAISASSRISQIADLVREATAHKTKITSLTDKISEVFVPSVIALSIVTFLVWAFAAADPQRGLSAAIAVLVIACPCALGIAVPMSLVVATSLGAKKGIVIRDPDTLSLLNRVRKVVLDKTGTLTTGNLRVSQTYPLAGANQAKIVAIAAAIERSSVHPIAKAIAALDATLTATNVVETAGSGVEGTVALAANQVVTARVTRYSASGFTNQADLDAAVAQAGPKSLVVVSTNQVALLLIALEDDIRQESIGAIAELKALEVEPVLMSGDATARVAAVAQQLAISNYFAEVTPEQKLSKIIQIKADGSVTAMVGDGLNDVAALAGADVGIAMGSGTHAAQSAAAITIINDNPQAIAYALQLSRRTWANIKQNLGWAFGYNVILIPIAALGLLNPMLAGSAMAFSSVSVVANALRLKLITH
jgi:P-type Cu+ transporter